MDHLKCELVGASKYASTSATHGANNEVWILFTVVWRPYDQAATVYSCQRSSKRITNRKKGELYFIKSLFYILKSDRNAHNDHSFLLDIALGVLLSRR